MKRILLAVSLVFLATEICMAQVPDLVGNWTGLTTGYVGGKLVENDSISLAIVEQNDRLFIGNVTYRRNGTEIVEAFAGAIGLDSKTLYIAENKGYGSGAIISDDEIEMIYLEDGKQGVVAIDKLHRV